MPPRTLYDLLRREKIQPMFRVGGDSGSSGGGGTPCDNYLPIAQNVIINNTTPAVGNTLTGSYDYYDTEGDVEVGTIMKWQVADDSQGNNLSDISGETGNTYLVDVTDIGKVIRFAVKPANVNGVGDWYYSDYTSVVTSSDVTAPIPSFSPDDFDVDIAINSNIVITFDEPILNTDGSEVTDANIDSLITLKDTYIGGSDIAFDATIDSTKKIVTINPTSNFSNSQTVFVGINNFEDADGNEQTTLQSVTFQTVASTIDALPYVEDCVFYVNTDFETDVTYDGSNRISEIINRVDPANNPAEINNTYKPIWGNSGDGVNYGIELAVNSHLKFTAIYYPAQNHTIVFSAHHAGTTTKVILNNVVNSMATGGNTTGPTYDSFVPPVYSWASGKSILRMRDDGVTMYVRRGAQTEKTRTTLHGAGNLHVESIGHAAADPSQSFVGTVYKIAIYNRFLSDLEVQDVYDYFALDNNP